MAAGIRATVKFTAPDGCPIARFSKATEAVIDQTATSVAPPGETGSVTEFFAACDSDSVPDAEVETDAEDGADETDGGGDTETRDELPESIFSYGTAGVYRTAHGDDVDCPCECLGQFGCPVHRYVADHGDLTLVFHAESFDQLQAVMGEFRARFDDVDVQRLLQPPLEGNPQERVFVNRGRLTDRQREVLQAAYERGYFERPKRANATELAADLDISQSTFTEHLVTAQRKILEDVLEGG